MIDYKKYFKIIEELKTIPHLDLLKQYDISKVKNEANQIKEFIKYKSKDNLSKDPYVKTWSGVSLYGLNGDQYQPYMANWPKEFNPYTEAGIKNMSITPIGKICPYIMSVMQDLGIEKMLSRIMRISPNSSLEFHSHSLKHGQPDNILTVQIPIYVPEKFKYVVKSINDNKTYEETYKEGRAYIFNSYHYHKVVNESNKRRLSIVAYMDLTENKCLDIVENAILNYKGPKIL